MLDISKIPRGAMHAEGRCRIDYTDPVTGKVLERIEGKNHVFEDQFFAQQFQTQNLRAALLLTNGTATLDTDLPYIPGAPIGYATPTSTASGLFRGAFRASDSYIDKVTQSGTESLYVYDFLTSQIPDTIRYVGLTGAYRFDSSTPSSLFRFRWPYDDFGGIYDIERKRLITHGYCSLSNDSGSIYVDVGFNTPGASLTRLDLYTLLGSPNLAFTPSEGWSYYDAGYTGTWGYDYDNQRIVFKLTRRYTERQYHDGSYHYTMRIRDDIWVVAIDGSSVINHYNYSWYAYQDSASNQSWQNYYDFWTGNYASDYMRLYNGVLYGFSQYAPDHSYNLRSNKLYIYKYDIATGTRTNSYVKVSDAHPVTQNTNKLYCFKGYTWSEGYYDQGGIYQSPTGEYMQWGAAINGMSVIPMYDVYTDGVYTYCPVIEYLNSGQIRYYVIEKGQTSVFGDVWNLKPNISSGDSGFDPDNNRGYMQLPFAFTAYKLPNNAPVRPAGSAVTIAYGLSISW